MTKRRAQQWERLVAIAMQLQDGAGRSVEEGILPVVVGLWAHGIPTRSSCEGHVTAGKRRRGEWTSGWSPPEVYVAADEPEKSGVPDPWELREQRTREGDVDPALLRKHIAAWDPWRLANQALQSRVIALLCDFYADHTPALPDERLTVMAEEFWGDFRVTPLSAPSCAGLPRRTQARRLAGYQAELDAFALFLQATFLAGLAAAPPRYPRPL